MAERPPASVFHEILENPTFHARWSPRLPGYPCKSHAPFHRSMAPPERIRPVSNIRDEKELAHFEKIEDNRPKNTITISDNRSQNHPRRGITLQA